MNTSLADLSVSISNARLHDDALARRTDRLSRYKTQNLTRPDRFLNRRKVRYLKAHLPVFCRLLMKYRHQLVHLFLCPTEDYVFVLLGVSERSDNVFNDSSRETCDRKDDIKEHSLGAQTTWHRQSEEGRAVSFDALFS